MEDAYLKRVLGDVLVEGLKETALEDPADPIDYLARWLLHYRDVEDQWKQFREDQKNLSIEKAEYLARLEVEMKRLEEERLAREAEEKRIAEEKAKAEQELAKRKKSEEEEEESADNKEPADDTQGGDNSTAYSESLSEQF